MMSPLKEHIINYTLKFISEREREVRISDLRDFIAQDFASELEEKCKEVPLSDDMYIDSSIRESYKKYNLTYTDEAEKLIGLTKEGDEAAKHPKGVSSYLKDKNNEEKSLKRRNTITFYTEAIAAVVSTGGSIYNCLSHSTNWLNNISYVAFGFLIGMITIHFIKHFAAKKESNIGHQSII